MHLTRQTWSPRRTALTPLIDVIFLLLLFFMLSSTFSKFGEIELKGGDAAASQSEVVVTVFVQLIGETIRVNGSDIAFDALDAHIKSLETEDAMTFLLSLDASATSQRFIDVYALISARPGVSLAVIN